jgi:hemolysin III
LPKLVAVMSISQIVWMTAGGLTYTLGAFIYALKRPNPWPDRVGFHGLFHISVVAAAVMHYVLVYGSVVR